MRVKMICSKNLLCFVFAFLSLEELRAFFLSNSEWRIQFLFSSWSVSCIPPKLYFHRLDKERGLISQTVDGNRALNLSLIWTIKGCKLRSISLKYINFKFFTIAFFAFLSSASRIHVESFLQYLALYPRTFSFVIPFLLCFCLQLFPRIFHVPAGNLIYLRRNTQCPIILERLVWNW